MGKSSSSNKSLVYQILIMFVLTFLVMETVMQGSILMLIRHLDLSANSPDLFVSHAVVVHSSTKDVYGYDVKFVPRIVTMDRLLLSRERGRPSLTELRNEQRPSAVRPLHLALVCPNLLQSSHSLYFISIAKALQVLGYTLEVKGFFLLVCNFHFQLHSCKVSICSILVFCGGCGWGLTRLVAARYKTL
jgi:hypothetical protein